LRQGPNKRRWPTWWIICCARAPDEQRGQTEHL
jgi:hypothetical protein